MKRLCVLLAVLTSCVATPKRVADDRSTIPDTKSSLELPPRWSVVSSRSNKLVICDAAQDLARLEVDWWWTPAAFADFRSEKANTVSPDRLAELSIADAKAVAEKERAGPVEVVETRMESICGEPGFVTHLRIPSESGLSYDSLQAGVSYGGRVYRIWYRAPTLHYFDAERAAFDHAVGTLRLR